MLAALNGLGILNAKENMNLVGMTGYENRWEVENWGGFDKKTIINIWHSQKVNFKKEFKNKTKIR